MSVLSMAVVQSDLDILVNHRLSDLLLWRSLLLVALITDAALLKADFQNIFVLLVSTF